MQSSWRLSLCTAQAHVDNRDSNVLRIPFACQRNIKKGWKECFFRMFLVEYVLDRHISCRCPPHKFQRCTWFIFWLGTICPLLWADATVCPITSCWTVSISSVDPPIGSQQVDYPKTQIPWLTVQTCPSRTVRVKNVSVRISVTSRMWRWQQFFSLLQFSCSLDFFGGCLFRHESAYAVRADRSRTAGRTLVTRRKRSGTSWTPCWPDLIGRTNLPSRRKQAWRSWWRHGRR